MVPNSNGFFTGLPVELPKIGKKAKPFRFVKQLGKKVVEAA